jgi:hypothetical protein
MTDETPEQQSPEPTFHLIPSLIVFGSAVLFGLVAGLIYNAL